MEGVFLREKIFGAHGYSVAEAGVPAGVLALPNILKFKLICMSVAD